MKKISWLVGVLSLFIFSGCFDIVEEITVNDNGSGIYTNTMDMGKILSLAKTFAGDNEKMKDFDKMKMDTLVNLKDIKDSVANLTEAEKKILEKGTLNIKMNPEDEVFSLKFSFPYSKPSEIAGIKQVLSKSKKEILGDKMKDVFAGAQGDTATKGLFGDQMPDNNEGDMTPSIDDYYTTTYEKNKISCKVKKEKYANVENDQSLKSLKELGQMGMPVNFKTVINLPKPAKKAEGKGVKLSDDKKKVTIEASLDDFFEDGKYLEYEIEY